jgi:hypothetical protein
VIRPTFASTLTLSAALAALVGCGGTARNAETYRADTRQLLDVRTSQLRGCYDEALAKDAMLAGTVTVHFVVAKRTGAIMNVTLDPKSSAPEPIGRCVVQALEGLKLDPADRHEGRASFEYTFQPPPAST